MEGERNDKVEWAPDLVLIVGSIALFGFAGVAVALVISTVRHAPLISAAALAAAEMVAGGPLDTSKAPGWMLSAVPALGAAVERRKLPAPAEDSPKGESTPPAGVAPLALPGGDDDGLGESTAREEKDTLPAALKRLPASLSLSALRPYPESPTAIPVGIDASGGAVWLDVGAGKPESVLHIGLYGASGAGKDTLLRSWFALLCKRNAPTELQFAILDGKGDWLVGNLAGLAHMWQPPAGGYGASGDKRITDAIAAIDREAERRQALITGAGCRTREEYNRTADSPLPLLVVLTTDMMTSVAGDVEALLIALVSKARALGIRVIVSMQTPTGKGTQWRMNLSTVIAGALQSGSQDEPALGIAVRDLRYRPSQLPTPQERPGVFVVRRGSEQMLVQAPYLAESRFDEVCASLPAKVVKASGGDDSPFGGEDDALFAGLLSVAGTGTTARAESAGSAGFGRGTDTGSAMVPAHQDAVPAGGTGTGSGIAGTGTDWELVDALIAANWSANRIYSQVGGNRKNVLQYIAAKRGE